jgi:hypothetical protein
MSENAQQIESLVKTYRKINALRPEVLFSHFLPTGYKQTTLDSVSFDLVPAVIYAKVHLGMIITLYDDLADHPQYRDSQTLAQLYHLNVDNDKVTPKMMAGGSRKNFELARFLFSSLTKVLASFPNFKTLLPVLQFDIEQFYACNRHSELMTQMPAVRNLTESRMLGSHNMGIVAAGTIDLMASADFNLEELSVCREVFLLGQRLGRISNIIYTLDREIAEGDTTNEILISEYTKKIDSNAYQVELMREFNSKLEDIRGRNVTSFNLGTYADGFLGLHNLYASLSGQI